MELGPRPTARALPAALALALLLPALAAAIAPSLETGRLLHDSWTDANGVALGVVTSLRQGRDGYLWIGSSGGLYRFDGLRFSAPPLRDGEAMPTGPVSDLLSDADGMWASTRMSLVHIRDGRIDRREDREPRLGVRQIRDAGGGAVWLLTGDTLSLLERGTPRRFFTAADGLPDGSIEAIASAGPGAVWLGIRGAVCRWTPGSRANCYSVPGLLYSLFSTGPEDVFAVSRDVAHISRGTVNILTRDLSALPSFGPLTVDRSGNVWIGTTSGLLRLRQGAVERYTHHDGLTGDVVNTIVEDAEGDLWVGTNSGLDRFRDPRVLHLPEMEGSIATAVAAAPDGVVWIGTSGHGVYRWERGSLSNFATGQGPPGRSVNSLGFDTEGALWLSSEHGVARFERGRFVPAFPGGPGPPQAYNLAADTAGGVWVADQQHGAWRIFGGRAAVPPELPNSDIFRLAGSPDGSMWLGYYNNGVFRWRNGEVQPVNLKAAGAVAPPRALFTARDGSVWIGAGRVLVRVRDGNLTAWGPRQGLPPEDLQSIAEDASGALWIATPASVLRIARPDPGGRPGAEPPMLQVTRYSHQDGLRARNPAGMYAPRLAVAADGRVWVTELEGVSILDPALLHPDTLPPPVRIEQIIVDGAPVPFGVRAFRGRETRIEYTGISLRAPARVHFKYRLDPDSQGWIDVQNQRSVSFVSPAPGNYTFRLMACNLDEVCNEEGGVLEFQIVPYFRQTIWFKLLLGTAFVSIAWGLHLLNVRRLEARFRLAAQERARVTREIHDTLLQGFAGVVYQLDAASRQFDSQPDVSKARLQKALDQADNALTEARRTLQDMRLPVLEDRTLPEALQEVGAKAVESGAAFTLRVKGAVASLPYAAQAAMFLIGREAINNAAKHSGAAHITVHLHYRDREFRLTIADDGSGFDPAVARQKTGHFGVDSMAVRARQAGAEFHIDTAPGKGAVITVAVKR